MLDPNLRPSQPPARRDVVIYVLASAERVSPDLIIGEKLEKVLKGIAETGRIASAEDFCGFPRNAVIETLAHLNQNGLVAPQGLTDTGREYADLVDASTKDFIDGYIYGSANTEQRHRDC